MYANDTCFYHHRVHVTANNVQIIDPSILVDAMEVSIHCASDLASVRLSTQISY